MITKLIEHLPHFYQESEFVKELQGAYTKELDNIKELSEKLLDQMFVETSDISLDYWETMLCVERTRDDVRGRQLSILEKIRSRRTTTIQAIKDLVYAYTGFEPRIEVVHDKYYYIIHLDKYIGYPPNLTEIVKAIDKINPAHLGIRWRFTFNKHIDFKGEGQLPTHEDLEHGLHKELFVFTHLQLEEKNSIAGGNTYPMTHAEMKKWSHFSLRAEDVFGRNPTFDHNLLMAYINGQVKIEDLKIEY